jgi:hypothetical protein
MPSQFIHAIPETQARVLSFICKAKQIKNNIILEEKAHSLNTAIKNAARYGTPFASIV